MNKKIIFGVIIIAILGIAGYYASFYFRKTTVNEEMPQSEMAGASVPQESTVLRQGTFGKVDFVHQGSGTAKLIKNTDGNYFIRFEDFKVTNGPDLYVYLAADAENIAEDEFMNLGRLKGSEGNQNYEVRKEGVDKFSTVIIWCQQFGVLFSFAELKFLTEK